MTAQNWLKGLRTNSFLFSLLSTKPAKSLSALSGCPAFTAVRCYRPHLAHSLVVSSLKSVCCDFSIFSAVMFPIACPLFNLVRNSVVHSPSSVIRDPRSGNPVMLRYEDARESACIASAPLSLFFRISNMGVYVRAVKQPLGSPPFLFIPFYSRRCGPKLGGS